MAKIHINGEWFDFDFDHKPMSEALALEDVTGMRYADWETELAAGSMKAMCALIWLVWRRNGREIELASLLSGETEVDLGPLLDSLQALAAEPPEPPGPTAPARTRRARTPTTGTATSPSSPASST